MKKRSGLAIAGNMIVDVSYKVETWPKQSELTSIIGDTSYTIGGAVCNVIVDLAKMDPTLDLQALGRVGDDGNGHLILDQLGSFPSIDNSQVRCAGNTSYSLVLNDMQTNARTFFHSRGANAAFSEDDIDWDTIHAKILHIGYILLLDALDEEDSEYGTKMARLLADAQKRGIKTSIDVVSEAGERFAKKVIPALSYTDYCIINELEAQATTGILLRNEKEELIVQNIPLALHKLKNLGVSTWAVIHCPEGGFGLDETNRYFDIYSPELPDGFIKGKVGAGDAFCAGVLYAAQQERNLEEGLVLGTASATCCLSEIGATEGLCSESEMLDSYHRQLL